MKSRLLKLTSEKDKLQHTKHGKDLSISQCLYDEVHLREVHYIDVAAVTYKKKEALLLNNNILK